MCVSVSLSGSVVLGCLFAPKLHIILFQPQKNVVTHRAPTSRFGSAGTRASSSQAQGQSLPKCPCPSMPFPAQPLTSLLRWRQILAPPHSLQLLDECGSQRLGLRVSVILCCPLYGDLHQPSVSFQQVRALSLSPLSAMAVRWWTQQRRRCEDAPTYSPQLLPKPCASEHRGPEEEEGWSTAIMPTPWPPAPPHPSPTLQS